MRHITLGLMLSWWKRFARFWPWSIIIVCMPWGVYWFLRVPSPGKAGVLLAVVATLMPLVWEKVPAIGQAGLILTLLILFAVEYRAIDREHEKYANDQAAARKDERDSFSTLLSTQEQGVQSVLDKQNQGMKEILEDNQKHFEATIKNLITAQHHESKDFEALLDEERSLFVQQSNTLEFLSGRLLPASDPTPPARCSSGPQDTIIFIGGEAHVTNTFPHGVLQVDRDQVIALDRTPSGALILKVEIRGEDGRIIFRMDQRGVLIPNNNLFVLRPDVSTLIIQDAYGTEMLNARYLNPNAFRINPTSLPIRGRLVHIPNMGGGSCLAGAQNDIFIGLH